MTYREFLLALAILFAGTVVAMSAGNARAEEHRHHAGGSAYQVSAASYDIPDVRLVDAGGVSISLRDVLSENEPVLLNFIFTDCSAICPAMCATFRQVQEQLGAERSKVRMVSISIDPENDSPERLRAYAARFEAGPQWRLLTGSAENCVAVQRAFGAHRGDKMNHAPATFLRVGGPGTAWVRLDGLASASDIVHEYHRLVGR